MRVSTLLPLVAAAPALALPSLFKPFTPPTEIATQAFDTAVSWVHSALSGAQNKWDDLETSISGDLSVAKVQMNGIEYLSLTHPAFPLHRLRVVKPELCDPNVNQLSGYLDISESKHLFFWFQESRHKPSEDPVMLWLNGGPGCSSTTGLLFELGGCNIADKGANVTYNEHSWNSVANVLYLDQPVGVGYSYSDSGEVNNSPAAAEDVYAFLSLFFSQYKEYAKQDFHISGESYAGTYIPNIASVIYKNSLALQSNLAPTPKLPVINLKSLLIGDGLTDPYNQFGSVPDWACDKTKSPYAVYSDPEGAECVSLRAKAARCQALVSSCYKTGSRFSCVPANLYCFSGVFGDLQQLGYNVYDVRKKCDRSEDKDGPLCYKEMGWMETYLNTPEVKAELGAPDHITFQSCNMNINRNFLLQGDGMHDAASLLPALIEDGIRVLIYAGEADMLVNFLGCEAVLDNLKTSYSGAFAKASKKDFVTTEGDVAGWTRDAGNVAFVAFHDAGHMVPHDDPVAALTMVKRWLKEKPLAK
ncbi:carboxypeptidase C [Naematelia encephala]|uniref:Carboxypeptidase n=1 Tax=Naematelia encephala TaxID=71784 RepID=A0A1Y2B339_9TREE|nr:carboxypeptidase C [Naematelia encephala]